MKRACVIAQLICVCSLTPVSAEPMTLLTTPDLTKELFGIHMFGHEQSSGMIFDECIEPSGQTVYRTQMDEAAQRYSEHGQLEITQVAQACFSYPPGSDPDPSCFRVFRYNDGYVFDSVDTGQRFIAERIVRNVFECPEPGEFLS